MHFHKAYDYQIWQAGTSRGANSNETNQAGVGDAIISPLPERLWQQNLAGQWLIYGPTNNVSPPFGYIVLQDHVTN